MKKDKKGFTLAELLVVVAIIGVLVAIAIPVFSGQLQKAKDGTNIANIRNSMSACYSEYISNGEVEKSYYFYNANNGFVYKLPKDSNLINSTYAMPVRSKKTTLFWVIFVVIDPDDSDNPIKTYPYVGANGDIVFESTRTKEENGETYFTKSPRAAFRNVHVNQFH